MQAASRSSPTPAQSLREYGRGVAGGLLFSLPLLYTMEVWWAGFTATPLRLLAGLAATFLLLLLYNRFAGLHEDATWTEVVIDSVEELGIGLLLSALVLWLLGRLVPGMTLEEVLGKLILEGMAAAVGVSVGTAQLGGGDENERSQGMADDDEEGEPAFLGQLALGICGSFLVAANVAPTEEVLQIAAEASTGQLLGLVALSLSLGGGILFFSGFTGAQRHVRHGGLLYAMRGTIVSYALALVLSAFLLWFFGRFAGTALFSACAQTVVLGVPATLGASAGRLLLQTNT